MAEVPGSLDRLPWLDGAAPGAPPGASPARRARRPLLLLLALFGAAAIALVAFLAGRATLFQAPPPTRTPAVMVGPLAPSPAPLAAPTAAAPPPAPIAAPSPVATRPTLPAHRRALARHAKTATHRWHRPARHRARPRPAVVVHRNLVPVPVAQRTYAVPRLARQWPARPFDVASGRVIQLGAFRTMRDADAAWWRLVRVYPYLGTLPRLLSWVGPTPGRARIYQLRLAAASRRDARALCLNLRRIGRGCLLVVAAK